MNVNTTMIIVATTILLVAVSVISPTFAQSSDPGAIGEIMRDSPLGQKIASGDVEPGRGTNTGCTSDFASGDRSNNPNCEDDGGDDE
jgi:hypothetical protein